MSALSIPPSQKACKVPPVGLEAMHNYANLLNPTNAIAYMESDQYSMVTVYEVELGATEVTEDVVEMSEEICIHAEDLSGAVSDHHDAGGGEDEEEEEEEEEVEEEVEEVEEVEEEEEAEEVEAEARTDGDEVEEGEGVDIATALETLTKTFAPTDELLSHNALELSDSNDKRNEEEEEEERAIEEGVEHCTEQIEHGVQERQESLVVHLLPVNSDANCSSEPTEGELVSVNDSTGIGQEEPGPTQEEAVSETQSSVSVVNVDNSCHLQMETLTSGQQILQLQNSSQQLIKKVDASIAPSVIAIKGLDADDSGEMVSIIFTCPQCPFHHSGAEEGEKGEENGQPHIHMQSVPAEEFRVLMASKSDGVEFVPTPCSTDHIFTSIKVLPQGSSESKPDRLEASTEEEEDGGSGGVDPGQSPDHHKMPTCNTCGRTFTRSADVRRHQLTHTGARPFHCSQCDRTFQHSWDLAKHETKHHGAAIAFSCQMCGASFANLRGLTVHHRGAHSGESQLPQICSICSRSFATTDDLLEHRRSHGDGQRYACHQCSDSFDTLLARSQHRQSHHAKRQFKCLHCDKTYTRRSDVKRHQATHTGERPHQCGQCGKRFSLRFMLAKHLSVHTDQRPFQCSHCPKRFTLVSILARHERMHTGEKPFLCSQCGKGFLSQGELSKHHRSHVDDKPYACIQCDKRFKSKRSQREHVLSHTGARPFLCTHCGKGFTKLYALTRHNLIHTGERPFPCAHCGKTFLTLGEAQLHQRIHTGERPYVCATCDLKFKSSSELGRHKRSHAGASGKWRLSCEQCGKSFSSQARLKKHLDGHAESQQGAPSQGTPTVAQTD